MMPHVEPPQGGGAFGPPPPPSLAQLPAGRPPWSAVASGVQGAFLIVLRLGQPDALAEQWSGATRAEQSLAGSGAAQRQRLTSLSGLLPSRRYVWLAPLFEEKPFSRGVLLRVMGPAKLGPIWGVVAQPVRSSDWPISASASSRRSSVPRLALDG